LTVAAGVLAWALSPPVVGAAPAVAPAATVGPDVAAWPQWRGPDASGVAAPTDEPLSWDVESGQNVAWRTEIEGRGHSSPVVWGDRIFLTTAIEGEVIPGAQAPVHVLRGEVFKHPDSVGADRRHTLRVLALDAADGRIVWSRTSYEGAVYDDRHKAGSYASPTVATDGERIYAYFGSEGLYVYDFEGNLVWSQDVGDIKTLGLGIGTSPVLWKDLVVIQADQDDGKESFLVALDKRSGKQVWKAARPVQATFTTPILVEDAAAGTQLVTSGTELIIAYDPATGRELWRIDGLKSFAIHVPLAAANRVVVTSGYPQKITKAIDLGKPGDPPRVAWTYNKGTGYVASNLLYDGYLYLTSDAGVLTCLDPATGEVIYEGGRPPAQGTYMASLVAVDGKILMVNRDGDAGFVKAGPRHEVLSVSSVDEPVYATPAIAGGRIYIRGERHLWAIGKTAS
jgi:outer membrane protein assembly factor BamB